MPIYEYVCKQCGENFEELVRADTAVSCPKCRSVKVERRFSTFACASGSGGSGSGPAAGGSCSTGGSPFS